MYRAIKGRGVSTFYLQVHMTEATPEEVICSTVCGRELIENSTHQLIETTCPKCRRVMLGHMKEEHGVTSRMAGVLYVCVREDQRGFSREVLKTHYALGEGPRALCGKGIAYRYLYLGEEHSQYVDCSRCLSQVGNLVSEV